MITNLTPEQEARFAEFSEKWTSIGLSTAPANRPMAEQGIRDAYAIAGLPAPKIVWCGSPLGNALTKIVLEKAPPSVWASVGASVRDSVRDSVWASVRDSVRASVWASVRASVWASVGDSVWASVGDSVGDSVRASVWASVGDSVYGQHDAEWLSFYDFFRVVCQLDEKTKKLSALISIAQSAGWFLPCRNICFVSERHNVLHRNDNGRLHCETGPALAYPDGWCIYALNGVRMEEWMVAMEPEKLDCKKVLAVENAEQRRELIRRIGVERMLSVLPHEVLNRRGDYELLSVRLSDAIPDARYLKMLNPSIGVWHVEGVAAEEHGEKIDTVQKAINWRSGDVREEWNPCQLT